MSNPPKSAPGSGDGGQSIDMGGCWKKLRDQGGRSSGYTPQVVRGWKVMNLPTDCQWKACACQISL